MNLSLILLLFFSTVSAILVNVTIDDTLGDSETGAQMAYFPSDAWNYGPDCRECPATALIDATRPFDGTWRDASSDTSASDNTGKGLRIASVSFHGTAIYVYCIVVNTQSDPDGYSNMTFLIDSHPAGNFVHVPKPGVEPLTYNVLVFAQSSLPDGNHTLTIQNGHVGGPKSLILLDYILYSYEKPATPASSPNTGNPSGAAKRDNTGKIAGAVLGAIGGLVLCLLGFMWYRQKPPQDSLSSSEQGTQRRSQKTSNSGGLGWLQRWRQSKKQHTRSPSHFSFNPGLLVRPVMQSANRSRTVLSRGPPPPVVTISPKNRPLSQPNSLNPLQPNRERTPSPQAGPSALQPLDPRAEPVQPMSITEWQRRTHMEADGVPPRLPVTDLDLSNYYEDDSTVPRPEPAHRPQVARPIRRFTVMNN